MLNTPFLPMSRSEGYSLGKTHHVSENRQPGRHLSGALSATSGYAGCRQASAQGFGHNMGVPYLRQPFIETIHRLKVGDNPSVSSRELVPGRTWV